MGFAVWVDPKGGVVWAAGTHEYRPMGTAVVARSDQFRPKDFVSARRRPAGLRRNFAGFYGSLEEVNVALRTRSEWALRETPGHL